MDEARLKAIEDSASQNPAWGFNKILVDEIIPGLREAWRERDALANRMVTRWMIERGQPEHQSPTVWLTKDMTWTPDPNEAMHFPSRERAQLHVQRKSGYVGDPIGRATEHAWVEDQWNDGAAR